MFFTLSFIKLFTPKTLRHSSVLLTIFLLSACVNNQPIDYSSSQDKVLKIHVSPDIVSLTTEIAGTDAHLPDSQVFVAKYDQGSNLVAIALFGAVGSIVAMSQDKAEAKKRASVAITDMTQNFASDVQTLLATALQQSSATASFVDDTDYVFKLLPSVRFAIDKSGRSTLGFRLTTRYKTDDGKQQTKNYYYSVANTIYALKGNNAWFGPDQHFAELKAEGFALLIDTFLADVTGQLPSVDSNNLVTEQQLSSITGKPQKNLVLTNNKEYKVTVPLFRNKPQANTVFVIKHADVINEVADETIAVTVDSDNTAVTDDDEAVTYYPELVQDLRSLDAYKMRAAAIKVGEDKLYFDAGIIAASSSALRYAVSNGVPPKDKYRIDGLAWCMLNLGNTRDQQHIPLLEKIQNSELPKKLRNHAIHAIKVISRG